MLFISTPEKSNYSDKTSYSNPFHKKELYDLEFKSLIAKYFSKTSYYLQSTIMGSLIKAENIDLFKQIYHGNYTHINIENTLPAQYLIATASDKELPDVNTSLFRNLVSHSRLLENERNLLKKTLTYRIGNLIVSPFKFIHSLFSK